MKTVKNNRIKKRKAGSESEKTGNTFHCTPTK